MNGKYEEVLFFDDLVFDDIPIDKLKAEKIPESPNAKVISGSFGRFNVNELPQSLRKTIEEERNMDWQLLYQQEPFESKGKPYRCICHNEDIRFGTVIYLELSTTRDGRTLVKSSHRNLFKKIYENYGEFLKEWEGI